MTYLTNPQNYVSTANSTSTPLGAAGVFTGTAETVTGYNTVSVQVATDQSGSLNIQFSLNGGSTWDASNYFNVSAQQQLLTARIPLETNVVRVVYTNGSTPQSYLRLKSEFITNYVPTATYPQQVVPTSQLMSASGRLRTSDTYSLIDVDHIFDKNTLIECESLSGASTSTYDSGNACVNLTVSGSGTVTRQTRRYLRYQTGKSALILMSGVINAASNAGTTVSQIGYFDANNGVFFQYNGTALSVSLMKSGTVIASVAQSAWNLDRMDGTGPSGALFNPIYAATFVFDFAWVVGAIRFGLLYNGTLTYVHEIYNTQLSNVSMATCCLPLRYSITSTGGSGTLRQISSSMISESASSPAGGLVFSANRARIVPRSVTTAELPIVAIRLKSSNTGALRKQVRPIRINLMDQNTSDIIVKVYIYQSPASDPLTGAAWTSADSTSVVEYDITATAFVSAPNSAPPTSGCTQIACEYFPGSMQMVNITFDPSLTNTYLTADIAGNSDVIVLAATDATVATAQNIYGTITWTET